jgi:hypothetical protein
MDKKIELHLPQNQYRTIASPGVLEKRKACVLEILPLAIRLNKDQNDAVEKLKVVVYFNLCL